MTEVVVAVGLLAIAAPLAKLGFDWLNSIARQRVMLTAQWQGQVALYDITRSVRNAEAIVSISSSTLVLRVLQPGQMGTFDAAALFDDVNGATMTFSWVTGGGGNYLSKTLQTPTKTTETKLLRNMIQNPVGNSYLFHPYPPNDTSGGPYDAVEIVLRLWPAFMKTGQDQPIEYRSISMRRARAQDNT